ncbi:DUF1454 family protein [Escherichia coli]
MSQFREKFNTDNPTLPLGEFRSMLQEPLTTLTITRAASKINENLYASAALERGTLKIKSIQITLVADSRAGAKSGESLKRRRYGSALMRAVLPTLTKPQSRHPAKATDPRQRQTLLRQHRRRGSLCCRR